VAQKSSLNYPSARCADVSDNRERLEIARGTSLPGRRVIRVLNDLVAVHGGQSLHALST
jgi:hypothetical protein